jgi:hypothetical protein
MRSAQDPTTLEEPRTTKRLPAPVGVLPPPPHPAWSHPKGYETPCARVRSMQALQLQGWIALACNDRPWWVVG